MRTRYGCHTEHKSYTDHTKFVLQITYKPYTRSHTRIAQSAKIEIDLQLTMALSGGVIDSTGWAQAFVEHELSSDSRVMRSSQSDRRSYLEVLFYRLRRNASN